MKQNILYTPKQVLEMFPDKDDLLYYLKMKFESPSIQLHVDNHEKVVAFIVTDIEGNIFTTFSTPGRIEMLNENNHNELMNTNKEQILVHVKTIGELHHKISEKSEVNNYLKIGFVVMSCIAILFFCQNHKNRPEEPNQFKLYQDSIEQADTTIYWTEKDTIK